jgi:hypothetical protein
MSRNFKEILQNLASIKLACPIQMTVKTQSTCSELVFIFLSGSLVSHSVWSSA